MKFIGFEDTKVTRLFGISRAEGAPYLPALAQAFVERYNFLGAPSSLEDLSGEPVSFRQGNFDGLAINEFDVYSDGIIVTSKCPSESIDKLLDDVTAWVVSEFGFKRIETHEVNVAYQSNIIVHSEAPIFSFLEVLESVQDRLVRALAKARGETINFVPSSFGLSADITEIAALKPIPFRFERRAGVPFKKSYYFSAAPLPTKEHLKLLEALEQAVKDI